MTEVKSLSLHFNRTFAGGNFMCVYFNAFAATFSSIDSFHSHTIILLASHSICETCWDFIIQLSEHIYTSSSHLTQNERRKFPAVKSKNDACPGDEVSKSYENSWTLDLNSIFDLHHLWRSSMLESIKFASIKACLSDTFTIQTTKFAVED